MLKRYTRSVDEEMDAALLRQQQAQRGPEGEEEEERPRAGGVTYDSLGNRRLGDGSSVAADGAVESGNGVQGDKMRGSKDVQDTRVGGGGGGGGYGGAGGDRETTQQQTLCSSGDFTGERVHHGGEGVAATYTGVGVASREGGGVATRGGGVVEHPYHSDYYDSHGDGSMDNLRPFFPSRHLEPVSPAVLRRVGQRMLGQMECEPTVTSDTTYAEETTNPVAANEVHPASGNAWFTSRYGYGEGGGGGGGGWGGDGCTVNPVLMNAPRIHASNKKWVGDGDDGGGPGASWHGFTIPGWNPIEQHLPVPGWNPNPPAHGFNPNAPHLPVPGWNPNQPRLPVPGWNPNAPHLPVPGFNPHLPPPGFNPNAPHLPVPGWNANLPMPGYAANASPLASQPIYATDSPPLLPPQTPTSHPSQTDSEQYNP